jgi:MFS family permease
MVLAGLVEGAVLGWSQSRVLRHRLSGFDEGRWIGATALAAGAAWFIGMLPSTFYEQWSTWPMLLSALVAVVLGTLLLGSIGLGQWIELRRHVPRAARWILITAAGWGAGLFVFMAVATPLWRPGQSTATIIAIGIGAAALMAVSMAGLTGWGMQHLLDPGDRVRRTAGHPSGRPERRPWRRTFVAVEGLVALGGAAGTVQLLAGIATPPDSALDPFERFGVSGWELPALWLMTSVAVPSAVAAAAALHGSPHAPEWVLLASAQGINPQLLTSRLKRL